MLPRAAAGMLGAELVLKEAEGFTRLGRKGHPRPRELLGKRKTMLVLGRGVILAGQ